MIPLELKEVICNLRNYDFDIHGSYKMDKKEAEKIIKAIEEMESNNRNIHQAAGQSEDKDVLMRAT